MSTSLSAAEKRQKRREQARIARREFWPTAKFVLGILRRTDPTTVVLKVISLVLNSGSWALFNTYFIASFFDRLEAGEAVSPRSVFLLLGGMALLLALSSFATAFQQKYFSRRLGVRLQRNINSTIYEKAAGSDLACFEDPAFYDKYIKAVNEAPKKIEHWLQQFIMLTGAVFNLTISLSFVLLNDPFSLIFVAIGLIVPIILGDALSVCRKSFQEELAVVGRRRSYMQRTAYLAEYAKDLRLSGISKLLFRRFEDAVDDQRDVHRKYGPKETRLNFMTYQIPFLLTYLLPMIYIAYRAIELNAFGVGTALGLVNAMNRLCWESRNTIGYFTEANADIHYLANLRDFLDHKNSITAPAGGGIAAKIRPGGSEIELRNVTFTYPGKEEPTLKNISFRIRAGETAAVVGPNGSGKTTLVKLLLRLYDPDSGEIYLDGRDIREYDPATLPGVYATVFQDHKLFGMTLGENVLLRPAETEADRAEATRCLVLADFGKKLARLEQGLDTTVTREFDDEGTNFSGGEAQKIAVARVYARSSSCVILDEPTSALDPIAEARMYENMETATKGKTVIFISHRLSSARTADRILVMQGGELRGNGRHDKLMKGCELYRDMFEKQAARYNENTETCEEVL